MLFVIFGMENGDLSSLCFPVGNVESAESGRWWNRARTRPGIVLVHIVYTHPFCSYVFSYVVNKYDIYEY